MNKIERSTKFWIIRSGIEAKCFESFYTDKCVALGWDKIGSVLLSDKIISLDSIKSLVSKEYGVILNKGQKEEKINRKIGDIASKIYRFAYEVQIGDIILTPSDKDVLIGRIAGEVTIVSGKYNTDPQNVEEKLIGQLNKVRRVEWLERIERDKLEPNIRLALRVVHGISQITQEQVICEINRTIYSLYEYGEATHSVYRIRNQQEIDFKKYAVFIECIKDVYDILCEKQEEKLVIKTNVQSPGPVELIGKYGIISDIVIAVRYLLKNEDVGIDKLGTSAERIKELKESSYKNITDDEYIDYVFPVSGTY